MGQYKMPESHGDQPQWPCCYDQRLLGAQVLRCGLGAWDSVLGRFQLHVLPLSGCGNRTTEEETGRTLC